LSDVGDYELTAENQFQGVVMAIHHDNVTAEVIVSIPSGETIVTTLSAEGIGQLGIREGGSVMVCFGADAVILAAVSA
jgi:molybdopterin-binding protein